MECDGLVVVAAESDGEVGGLHPTGPGLDA